MKIKNSCMESGVSVGKGKKVGESGKENGLDGVVILRASLPGLVDEWKTVQSSGNPNGQGNSLKKNGRVLRDVTNNLEEVPLSRKPC